MNNFCLAWADQLYKVTLDRLKIDSKSTRKTLDLGNLLPKTQFNSESE